MISGNMLKIIAAVSLLIDHIGVVFLPDAEILRIIGRLAFPVYAFMIAEGCAYTRNKLRYFLCIFALGAACQIVYYIYDGGEDMGILITFSLAILVIYAMQYLKEALFAAENRPGKQCAALLIFLAVLAGVYLLNGYFHIDYGFWGCVTPALASVFRRTKASPSRCLERLDSSAVHVLMLGLGLVILACEVGGVQVYSLFAIPLLLLYSGKRGKWKMKWFFYVFYPAHLAILQCIFVMLKG